VKERVVRTRQTYDKIAGRFLQNTRDRSPISSWLGRFAERIGAGAEWESKRYGEPRWFQFWSAADLDALLTDSGFEVIGSWSNSTPRADWLVRHAVPAARGA
jgi:hypothetical protein